MIEATLMVGIIFVVLAFQNVTNKQLKKMKVLDEMYTEWKKSGLSVAKFCKEKGTHQSKFYYWKKRYGEQKEKGLIDRRKGMSYKVTKDRKKFIIECKIKKPLASCYNISDEFKRKFGEEIHFTWVAKILREEKLNDPVGRKTGKRFKKTSD